MTPRGLVVLVLVLLTGCATGVPVGYRVAAGAIRYQPRLGSPQESTGSERLTYPRDSHELGSHVDRRRTAEEARSTPCPGGQAMPPGWPHLSSSEEVLAPFLACASPAQFVAMQRGVDMPRLVEALDDWQAVRLGALGPLDAKASALLTRKRTAFLLTVVEEYGLPRAEVFALFVLHSAFDDELLLLLRLLGDDKHLGQTLGHMPAVREELRRRGLTLSEWTDRAEQGGDVLRGLGRAARDALSSTDARAGARYLRLSAQRAQLPPPYQRALDEVEQALMKQHFSAGNVALGSFDHLTFGVPLGFYHLVVGTGHGVHSLTQRKYEQATRELAPAALLVGLYVGGQSARSLSEAMGAGRRLPVPTLRLEGLKGVVERLGERLGVQGIGELARYIRASREAALLVCEGGEAAAAALHEARGDVARAQAWLSEARPQRTGSRSTSVGADTPIRNGHLAGGTHPVTGVPFDVDGYPDFRAAKVVKAEVKIEPTGSRARDFAAANKAAGLRETPKGMTWHHHQDRMTMQLVPTEIHAKTGHTGGFSGEN